MNLVVSTSNVSFWKLCNDVSKIFFSEEKTIKVVMKD